jgi:hypothetical protein
VHDPEHPIFQQERYAQQRADALLAQDRVEDLRPVDVGDDDRSPLRGHPSRESGAQRDPHALLDLLLDSLRGAGHQLAGVLVEQEHGDGVDAQRLADAFEQVGHHRLEPSVGQRDVGDRLQTAQLFVRRVPGRERPLVHLFA